MAETPRGETSPESKEVPREQLFEFIEATSGSVVVDDAKKALKQKGLEVGVVNFGKRERAQLWQQAETVKEFLNNPRAAVVIARNLYPTHDIRSDLSIAIKEGKVLQFLKGVANKRLSDDQSSMDREEWAKEHAAEIVKQFREAMLGAQEE